MGVRGRHPCVSYCGTATALARVSNPRAGFADADLQQSRTRAWFGRRASGARGHTPQENDLRLSRRRCFAWLFCSAPSSTRRRVTRASWSSRSVNRRWITQSAGNIIGHACTHRTPYVTYVHTGTRADEIESAAAHELGDGYLVRPTSSLSPSSTLQPHWHMSGTTGPHCSTLPRVAT